MAGRCKTAGCERKCCDDGLCSYHHIFWRGLLSIHPEYAQMSEAHLNDIKIHLDGYDVVALSEATGIGVTTLFAALQRGLIKGEKIPWPAAGKWQVSMFEAAKIIWQSRYWVSTLQASEVCKGIVTSSVVYLYTKSHQLGPTCKCWNGVLRLPRSLVEDTKWFRRLVEQAKAKMVSNKPMCRTFGAGDVSLRQAAKLLGIASSTLAEHQAEWRLDCTRTPKGYYLFKVERLRLFVHEVRRSRITVPPEIYAKISTASF